MSDAIEGQFIACTHRSCFQVLKKNCHIEIECISTEIFNYALERC